MSSRLLIATKNPGKVEELSTLLSDAAVDVMALTDFPDIREVEETGRTFTENAQLKAAGYAAQTGLTALADDSGLEVLALGGRPGVLSARYGPEGSGFDEKMRQILHELAKAGGEDRRARFVCSMSIADARGEILATADGLCNGRIADAPRGTGGFGYDPIFIPDGFDRTFGELSSEIKQEISHRALAFREIIPFLRLFLAI